MTVQRKTSDTSKARWAALIGFVLVLHAAAPALSQDDFVINLNTASESTLERLPGIGPVKARDIVRYRRQHGDFEHPTELLQVPGIGQRTYANLCRHVEANGARGCDEEGRIDAPTEVTMPSLAEDGRLNVNLASAQELEVLPRIGPALSQRIVDFRNTHGLFRTVEALEDVSGIGPATLDQIRAFVTVQANVNTASISVLEALGMPTEQAEAIVEYREREGFFEDLDELAEVPGVEPAAVDAVRPFLYADAPLEQ